MFPGFPRIPGTVLWITWGACSLAQMQRSLACSARKMNDSLLLYTSGVNGPVNNLGMSVCRPWTARAGAP